MRKVTSLVLILVALGALLLLAPAPTNAAGKAPPIRGGGDSEPIGPWPHVVCHAPATMLYTQTVVTVWGHSHNMVDFDPELLGSYRTPPRALPMTITDVTITSWEEDQHDVRFTCNVAAAGLNANDVIKWLYIVTNYDDWDTYSALASTTVD